MANYSEFLVSAAKAGLATKAYVTAKNLDKYRLIGGPNVPYSSGLRLPNGTDHLNSTNTRMPHFIRSGTTEIRLVYMGYYNNNAAEQVLPNPVTFTASIENPALNFFGQICANGNPTMTLYPGGILITDPIPVDIGSSIPYFRHFATVTAGGSYPTSVLFNNSTWSGSELQTTSTTDATQSAQMGFAYASNAFEFNFCQCAIIGKQLKRTPVILGDGDSIMQGTGTNSYLSRGWLISIIDGLYANGNIGYPGNTASNSTLSQNNKSRMLFADWADGVIEDFGTNDFAGNATHAATAAFRIERWSQYARRGLSVAACTVFPRSTSTDNFLTEANQTPLTAWLAGGNAQLHNAWIRDGAPMTGTLAAGYVAAATGSNAVGVIRAGQAGHVLSSVFDQAIALQGTKVGTWQGNATQVTPDGIHVTDNGVALIHANAVNAAILSWCASIPLN